MNKKDSYKDFSKRFEREAKEGFKAVHGSEVFFNELKNPFTRRKYRVVNRKGHKLFLVFETMLLLAGLILLLKYTWLNEKSAAPPTIAGKRPATKNILPAQVTAITQMPVVTPQKKDRKKPVHHTRKSTWGPAQPIDSALAQVPPVNHPAPPVDSAGRVTMPVYKYTDYKACYKLRYMEDLLVVDYGDSVARKMKPILNGVPANLEKNVQAQKTGAPDDPFELVGHNIYLEKLQEAIQAFGQHEWAKAEEFFEGFYSENNNDQNALFYGALCLYESGRYQGAVKLLQELKQVSQPVFEQEADYYTALVYIKNGDTEKAQEKLQNIVHSNSFYRHKAVLLLQELK